MNEILAIIVFAFFAERVETAKDFDSMAAEEIGEKADTLVEFIFDYRHTFADIYSVFSKMMAYGIKNLY